MLIVNDDHRMQAGVCSLDGLCPYCGSAFTDYPLIMSDHASQTVYHAACALQLATEILVDLFTFFIHTPVCLLSWHPLCTRDWRERCNQQILKRSRPRCGSKRFIHVHG
jgi:hypothetical protein